MTHRTSTGAVFTAESVESALENHRKLGTIESWRATGEAKPNHARPLYVVQTTGDRPFELATIWEARAFVAGLASAQYAFQRRQEIRDQAREQDEAERQKRLQAEHDRDAFVTEHYDCATCGSDAGQRCVRTVADETPYAAHPHAARIDRANRSQHDNGLVLAQGAMPR